MSFFNLRRRPRLRRALQVNFFNTVLAGAGGLAWGGADEVAAIAAHVDAAAGQASIPAARRARYAALDRVLSKADRPGLADDFAKLERVAAEVAGGLGADDPALVALLDAALDAGLGEDLPAEDAAVARLQAAVDAGAARRSVDAQVRTARTALRDARSARDDQDRDDLACRAAGRAARALATARRVAETAVRRQDARPPKWTVVLDGRPGPLLSVWVAPGPAPDVCVVGADALDGGGPQFLRGGYEGWARVPVAPSGDLWWVDAVPGDGLWACGSGGLVVRYDPATGAVEDRTIPGLASATLYGVWGARPDEVWAVAVGAPEGQALQRWDGAQWAAFPVPPEAQGRGLTKLWGRAADDVWACGSQGTLIHWDGAAWTTVAATDRAGGDLGADLLTVHGSAKEVVAVGAVFASALVGLRRDGTFASAAIPAATQSLAGVYVPLRGDAWAVGYHETLLRRRGKTWRTVAGAPPLAGRDLHAVHVDDAGGVWVAGGDILRMEDGVLLHYGARTPSSEILPRASFRSRVAPLFAQQGTCADIGCHSGPFRAEFDVLDAGALHPALRAAAAGAPLLRTLPARPSASYLWRKLTGTHAAVGGGGAEMPQGKPPLADADLAAVRAWILEGAPDSE